MRYLIATGGTGGHIYPALALVDEIKQKDPQFSVKFIGSSNRMEATEIPKAGYPFDSIDVTGMNGGLFRKLSSAYSIGKAYFKCKKMIQKEKPDVVIGFGNYISVPVVLAAHNAKIITLIHEQNSYAGKANRMLAKYVDGIIGCYEENLKQFPREKTKILGNPRASIAAKIKKNPKIIENLGLNPFLPLVVIVMGSLGSESMNEVMKEALELMKNKDYQVLYVTGKNHYVAFNEEFTETDKVKIVPYINGCEVMINATCCVVRGGATTAAEICAMGMPCIIIPSPYVPNNHQVKNAEALQNAHAAIMLEEKDCQPQNIIEKIDCLVHNNALRDSIAFCAKQCGKSDASDEILKWILELKG